MLWVSHPLLPWHDRLLTLNYQDIGGATRREHPVLLTGCLETPHFPTQELLPAVLLNGYFDNTGIPHGTLVRGELCCGALCIGGVCLGRYVLRLPQQPGGFADIGL